MRAIACRQAKLDDAGNIHALLLQVAPEIPLLVDSLEREEALYALVRNCARSGESWVAVDQANRIIGFVLIEPNQLGRHYAEHELLDLRYAVVAAAHRNQGIFAKLIENVVTRMVPVTTSVSQQNRSGIARRLEQFGFHQIGSAGGEQRFRREPGALG